MSVAQLYGNVGLLTAPLDGAALVLFPGNQAPEKDTGGLHSTVKVHPEFPGTLEEIEVANWGGGNTFAQDLVAEMNKNGVGKAGLRIRVKSHFGGGPQLFREQALNDRTPVPPTDPASAPVVQWLRTNRVNHLQGELVAGFEWWGQCLVECVASRDLRSIVSVRPLKPAWCRFSTHDESNGRSNWVVLNPNVRWGTDSGAKILPLADPWWTADQLRDELRRTGHRKFVLPTWVPDPDAGYYPTMDWHATYLSGWLQQTNSIPALKKAVLLNQVTIKYHIQIPAAYFEAKYGEQWATMSQEQRDAAKLETLQTLDTWLKGAANAGKSLVTYFETDAVGNPLPGWKIEALDDKLKDGAYIPDSEKGNSEILAAMAVDPTLLGQGAPGGKLGAGSGSDKREAIVILQALQAMDRASTTEWFNLVRDFNGWPQDLVLGYDPMALPVMNSNLPTPAPAPAPGGPPAPEPDPGNAAE